MEWLSETKGLNFDHITQIRQSQIQLPPYIPIIGHSYSRLKPLAWPIVGVNTCGVFANRRKFNHNYLALSDSSSGLRDAYKIAQQSRIIMCGIANDPKLELYWQNRRFAKVPEVISNLGIDAAIGPNFSHFLGVPRTDNLFNRLRQLICLQELQDAGVQVIPHLNAVMPYDWHYWQRFLKQNESIKYVAIEFQTGNKNTTQGRQAIDQLTLIQSAIRRPLHFIIVGGGQFIEYAAVRFESLTLIDSMPFIKSMQRQCFDRASGNQPWRAGFRLIGQDLDDYLLENITKYSDWILERIQSARSIMLQNN